MAAFISGSKPPPRPSHILSGDLIDDRELKVGTDQLFALMADAMEVEPAVDDAEPVEIMAKLARHQLPGKGAQEQEEPDRATAAKIPTSAADVDPMDDEQLVEVVSESCDKDDQLPAPNEVEDPDGIPLDRYPLSKEDLKEIFDSKGRLDRRTVVRQFNAMLKSPKPLSDGNLIGDNEFAAAKLLVRWGFIEGKGSDDSLAREVIRWAKEDKYKEQTKTQ